MKSRYKIVFRGGYGLTNFGDDALMKSLHEDYKRQFSSNELAYNCTIASYLNKIICGYSVIPLSEKNIKTDLLIFGGGTQFYSFERNNLGDRFKNNIETFKNPYKLLKKTGAFLKRAFEVEKRNYKIVALGIGVGPFLPYADPSVEKKVANLFRRMEFVAVRDLYSYNKCKEWGVQNYGLYSDLCFNMNNPLFFRSNNGTKICNVGIVVRDWKRTETGEAYYQNLMEVTQILKKFNINFHFFVFSKDGDYDWVKILKSNNLSFNQWDPTKLLIDEYIIELDKMDMFITARYHGAIFSALLGKPFITIDIEPKLALINKLYKKGSLSWSFPFLPNDLIQDVIEINKSYKNFAEGVYNVTLEQQALAKRMREDLLIYINKI